MPMLLPKLQEAKLGSGYGCLSLFQCPQSTGETANHTSNSYMQEAQPPLLPAPSCVGTAPFLWCPALFPFRQAPLARESFRAPGSIPTESAAHLGHTRRP